MSVLCVSCTALPPPQEWFPRHETEAAAATRTSGVADGRAAGPATPLDRLTWGEALRLAGENSPTVVIAARRIARAEARLREARSLAYPTVDARANYVRFVEAATFRGRTDQNVAGMDTRARFFTDRGSDVYSAGVDVNYPLFDGGAAYFSREAASADLDASKYDREAVLNELELRVSAAYLDILLSEGRERIAVQALDFTREQVRQARAREEVGEGLQVDRLRFETRASEQQLALNRVRANRGIEIAVLSELLGVPVSEDGEFPDPEAGLALPEGDLVARALDGRPEMRALRSRVEATVNDLKKEKSTWWPSVGLFASYGFISLDDLKLSSEEEELTVGGGMAWNLFQGGGTVARTAALRSEVDELVARQRELSLQIEREVRAAEIDLGVARENLAVTQETVTLAQEVLERISAQYAAGEAQVIDVNDAELQRTRAQSALLQSRVNVLLSQARLRRAVGLGTKRDE